MEKNKIDKIKNEIEEIEGFLSMNDVVRNEKIQRKKDLETTLRIIGEIAGTEKVKVKTKPEIIYVGDDSDTLPAFIKRELKRERLNSGMLAELWAKHKGKEVKKVRGFVYTTLSTMKRDNELDKDSEGFFSLPE
jgi:hypothetical protein